MMNLDYVFIIYQPFKGATTVTQLGDLCVCLKEKRMFNLTYYKSNILTLIIIET